jgi:hypothetical protein
MRISSILICCLAFGSSAVSFAAPPPPAPNEPNCQAVYNACTQAGYIYGDAGKGNGLYKDCIKPLVTGTTPPKAPPPGITFPAQVSQQAQVCHQHHPRWGAK